MKNKKYLILSIVSITLWVIVGLHYHRSQLRNTPTALAELIQEDVFQKQKDIATLLSDKRIMQNIWEEKLTESQIAELSKKAFVIHFIRDGELAFWNSNSFPINESSFSPKWKTLIVHQNAFMYRSIGNASFPNKRINLILPIYAHFDINNEYLKSGFLASKSIPATSKVSLNKVSGAFAIKGIEGENQFYLSINPTDIRPFRPDAILLSLLLMALLSSILALQLISINLSRIYSSFVGLGFITVILIAVHALVYFLGLPFHLQNLDVFSPLVFASSDLLPSFGHLFIHIFSIYWFLSLLLPQFQKSTKSNILHKPAAYRWSVLVIELVSIMLICFYIQRVVKSIVFDSNISFDTNTFNATDTYTFFSIIILAVLGRVMFLKLHLANIVIKKTIGFSIKNYLIVFLILLFINVTYILLTSQPIGSFHQFKFLDFFALVWGILFLYYIGGSKLNVNKPRRGLFPMIFVSVYLSILFALFFKHYVDEKEMNITRISFAETLSRQQDPNLEIKFDQLSHSLVQDSIIQNWLQYSDSLTKDEVLKYLRVKASDLFYNNYSQKIFLYDEHRKPIIGGQNIPIDSFLCIKAKSLPTINQFLFFRTDIDEQGAYLVMAPIMKSQENRLIGYIVIDFRLKQNITQSVYPKLLKNQQISEKEKDYNYDYAKYVNKQLVSQSGAYNFDYKIEESLPIGAKEFRQNGDFSQLLYKVSANTTLVVVYHNKKAIGVLTIFSFLFGIFLLLSTVENFIAQISSVLIKGSQIKSLFDSRMSVRIKYFVLGFTGISFFVIGISTVFFLKSRYEASNIENLEETTNSLSEAVMDYLNNNIKDGDTVMNQVQFANNEELAYFLTNIAQQQKIDLNVFDKNGKLAFSTHDNIYKTNVLSNYMSYQAKSVLSQKKLSSFPQSEKAGGLNYMACYAPLFNQKHIFIGYLNVPFFYTKEHIDNQIISLITTLANIYTVLILISSLITFLFINNLTRSLSIIADGLKNVNLKKNELIHWPYKDEIGLLVEGYNKMVATVEQTARSMVLDERQNAWREMAQQVAHEIKNPLTPMKLNIQYLQQAINSNHPDIINLTKRVSNSIIEQIDNLNYIASEFSNFAKMPENKTERIDLRGMLENIVLLFSGNKNLTITHDLPQEQIVVFADKSQMLRIFTNIVQNAVESLSDENPHGLVDIRIYPLVEKGMVEITVSDNGSGVPEEVKDKIFDPYFTTKSSGTGLGLAMSKKIIELWGGSIRFESTLNVGTTFYLQIPMG
jgi:two-component system, NtrC family, nitrogen regulation sensor histidine kinase NtrY